MTDGIRWETGERVMTPAGVRRLYSWRTSNGEVLTKDSVDRVEVWHALDIKPVPPEPGEAARWALRLYRECQRDAAADPWWEPGGAERRFIAKLREYAGEAE